MDYSAFHIDPIQIGAIIGSAIVIWTRLRSTVKWHTEWINRHEQDDRKRDDILSGIRETNAVLAQISKDHESRIDRIERRQDMPL